MSTYRRLSPEVLAEIRAAKGLAKSIAWRFRISPSHLSRIRNHGWNPRGTKIGGATKLNATLITLAFVPEAA